VDKSWKETIIFPGWKVALQHVIYFLYFLYG